jgi:DNA-binding response OmpR family regulator
MIYLMICQGSRVAVDNFIATLRAKIEENPAQPRHLITVRGVGYRLDR